MGFVPEADNDSSDAGSDMDDEVGRLEFAEDNPMDPLYWLPMATTVYIAMMDGKADWFDWALSQCEPNDSLEETIVCAALMRGIEVANGQLEDFGSVDVQLAEGDTQESIATAIDIVEQDLGYCAELKADQRVITVTLERAAIDASNMAAHWILDAEDVLLELDEASRAEATLSFLEIELRCTLPGFPWSLGTNNVVITLRDTPLFTRVLGIPPQ